MKKFSLVIVAVCSMGSRSMAQCPTTVNLPPVVISCGSPTAIINAGTTSQPSSYSYLWGGFAGHGFSCQSCYSTAVFGPGTYTCSITNNIGGCTVTNTVEVVLGTITADFTPSYTTGCIPFAVTFTNNSMLGANVTGTVTTTWNYGNGAIITNTNVSSGGSPNGSTTYTSNGNYTVILTVQQTNGTETCSSADTTLIQVSCVGIEELENEAGISIFPQPANDRFTVFINKEVQQAIMDVRNQLGQQLYSTQISTGSNSIDCSLPGGIYYITISEKNKVLKRTKLLVE